jgi:hypothetical protein
MNIVFDVNGEEVDLDIYNEITDPEFIAALENIHFDKHTKKYVFDYCIEVCRKVGDKWYNTTQFSA